MVLIPWPTPIQTLEQSNRNAYSMYLHVPPENRNSMLKFVSLSPQGNGNGNYRSNADNAIKMMNINVNENPK